jgi:hypothetical protein
MVAVRAADVTCPGEAATALLAAGSPVASGEPLVFTRPVLMAPAVVRRSGAVQAGKWLPDHVRLGLLEEQLGESVIETVAEAAVRAGRLARPVRRRLMSLELTCRPDIRATLPAHCAATLATTCPSPLSSADQFRRPRRNSAEPPVPVPPFPMIRTGVSCGNPWLRTSGYPASITSLSRRMFGE